MIRRFLADADLNGAIVSGIVRRRADIDFKRAHDVRWKASAMMPFWRLPRKMGGCS